MFEIGAVRKTRKLTRICVVLGVILLFSSIGMTLTTAAPNENPPGQDQCDDGHGANDKPCTTDPSDHGQECEEHGNGGVNEDHCAPEGGTTGGTTTGGSSTGGSSTGEGTGNSTGEGTGGSSTGEGTGNATGNSTGEGTGNATGNSTGEGTGNATGNATGNSTGEGTGNATGNATGNSTGGSSTTGTSTGGAENGTTTGAPAVSDDTQVLGKTITKKQLATTGNETTILAVFGFAFLLFGSALRFGRFGTRVAMATASPADQLVARSLALIERTVRPGSRDWYCN